MTKDTLRNLFGITKKDLKIIKNVFGMEIEYNTCKVVDRFRAFSGDKNALMERNIYVKAPNSYRFTSDKQILKMTNVDKKGNQELFFKITGLLNDDENVIKKQIENNNLDYDIDDKLKDFQLANITMSNATILSNIFKVREMIDKSLHSFLEFKYRGCFNDYKEHRYDEIYNRFGEGSPLYSMI